MIALACPKAALNPGDVHTGMKGPERIETARLVLRKPTSADAEAVFHRYSSDPEVTKFLGWSRHRSVEQTRVFLT